MFERRASALLDQIANASGRTIDTLYASLVHKLGLTAPFFRAGWGDLKIVDFNEDAELLHHWPPPHFDIKVEWEKVREGTRSGAAYELLQCRFRTPCQGRLFDALPEESRTTHVQLLAPKTVGEHTACVVHLAGTGDHGFERRLALGAPLLNQGIATMVLESPYYGRRRPAWQSGSRLWRVSDLLVLGRATIEESLCLLEWAKQAGFQKLGMSGFSMGGVHASMVAALFPGPVACAPLLAPRSASVAFCDGALWEATAWRPLAQREDEKRRDVMAVVREAAQPGLLAAAAARVLRDLPHESSKEGMGGNAQENLLASQHLPGCRMREAESSQAPPPPNGIDVRNSLETNDDSAGQRSASKSRQTASESASETTSNSYSSAAAFLGFRLPGWKRREKSFSRGGIGVAERQLRSLWRSKGNLEQQDARKRLETVLETYTDVTRFPCPKQPSAAVIVGAMEDAYVTRESIRELAAHWPGSEVRWVPGGHVSAFLLQQPAFRSAITDSLDRLRRDDGGQSAPAVSVSKTTDADI